MINIKEYRCKDCETLLNDGRRHRCDSCNIEHKRKKSLEFYYRKLRPQKISYCASCSKELEVASSKKFCELCSSVRRKQKMKQYKRAYLNKLSDEELTELRQKHSVRKRNLRQERKESGLCIECGNFKKNKNLVRCASCHKKDLDTSTKFNRKKGRLPSGQSGAEDWIFNLLSSVYDGQVLRNVRNIIPNPSTGYFLELDFWCPDIQLAIEVDGPMHRPDSGYGKKRYEYQKRNDQVKDTFCKNNNILLVRIPTNASYWGNSKKLRTILSQAIQKAISRIEGATHSS